MKKICVIGSLNTDLVATADHFPRPGETVFGTDFQTTFGGKGGNQAVALGRLEAKVAMAGMLGTDLYGQNYYENLKNNQVDASMVRFVEGASGVAVIEVESSSQNHIIAIPGANGKVTPSYIDEMMPMIKEYDIFLFQLEIPIPTITYALERLKAMGKTIVLDPAPAIGLLEESILAHVDYLTPNETEIEIAAGMTVQTEDDLKKAAQSLLDKGVKTVIAKAGGKGAYLIGPDQFLHIPPYKVDPMDTTAAGDSFNAGLAFGLATGQPIEKCVKIANAVGGLATTGMGAQSAMPDRKTVEGLMDEPIC